MSPAATNTVVHESKFLQRQIPIYSTEHRHNIPAAHLDEDRFLDVAKETTAPARLNVFRIEEAFEGLRAAVPLVDLRDDVSSDDDDGLQAPFSDTSFRRWKFQSGVGHFVL